MTSPVEPQPNKPFDPLNRLRPTEREALNLLTSKVSTVFWRAMDFKGLFQAHPDLSGPLANFARSLETTAHAEVSELIFQGLTEGIRTSIPNPAPDDPHFVIPPLSEKAKYPVGIRSLQMVRKVHDPAGELVAARRLVMDIHFPGVASPKPVYRALQGSFSMRDPKEQELGDNVWTRSQVNLAPSKAERFPLILFSHGGGMGHYHYCQIVEELAGRGYCVVSVSHPSSCNLHHYFGQDPLLQNFNEQNPEEKGIEIETRARDLEYVLEQLPSFLPDNIDTTQVGFVGHSLGGAASVLAASETVSCKGAINLDGAYFGTERPVGKPVLRIESGSLAEELEEHPDDKELKIIAESINRDWARFDALNPANHELLLMPEATHMDFTMIPLIDHKFGANPDIKTYRSVCERTNAAIIDFFDSTLKAATE